MTDELDSQLKRLLKDMVQEVAADLVDELKASIHHQEPQATLAGHKFLLSSREAAKGLSISESHLFNSHALDSYLVCVSAGACVTAPRLFKNGFETRSAHSSHQGRKESIRRNLP